MKLSEDPLFETCNKMWQYLIKDRAGWRCEMCYSGNKGLHAAHIIGRGAYWTRWRLRNGLALCPDCHDYSKIKTWMQETAERRRRWRWILKQKQKIHLSHGPNLKTVYKRLRRKGAA